MSVDEDVITQFRSQFNVIKGKLARHKDEYSGKGATIWDVFLRADKELLELAQRLRSTSGYNNFNETIRLNTEIVSYLKVLESYGLIKPTKANLADFNKYEKLQQKYLKAEKLIRELNSEESRLQRLKENIIKAKAFLTDYYATLKSDKDLNPYEVDSKLESKVLQSRAYSKFNELVDKDKASYLEDNEVKALLPENIEEDKISGLDEMIVKYNKGVIYIGCAQEAMQQTSSRIEVIKRDLELNHITSRERQDLDKFKSGEHQLYNFGNYTANYWRTVMKNMTNFFKELGIKNITINL